MPSYRHSAPEHGSTGRIAGVGLLATSVGLLATAGDRCRAEGVTSGTLHLNLCADVGVGSGNFAGRAAPGDTDNVYVNLENTGILASRGGRKLTVSGLPGNAVVNGSVAGDGQIVTMTHDPVPSSRWPGRRRRPPARARTYRSWPAHRSAP